MSLAAAAMLAACGGSQPPIGAPGIKPVRSHEQIFHYTGTRQWFTVPAGVTRLTITAHGATGASGYTFLFASPAPGGAGEIVTASIPVAQRDRLAVFVGGRGRNGGFNGGGALKGPDCCRGFGGGASDVRQGGLALVDRVIVAAGGGGAGNAGYVAISASQDGGAGGAGGGTSGAAGQNGEGPFDGGGGAGGSHAGGGAGGYGGSRTCGGSAGKRGAGGAGGPSYSSGCGESGGGGGGGYYGGGGGGSSGFGTQTKYYAGAAGGGGGGSSFAEQYATNVTMIGGRRGQAASVVIRW